MLRWCHQGSIVVFFWAKFRLIEDTISDWQRVDVYLFLTKWQTLLKFHVCFFVCFAFSLRPFSVPGSYQAPTLQIVVIPPQFPLISNNSPVFSRPLWCWYLWRSWLVILSDISQFSFIWFLSPDWTKVLHITEITLFPPQGILPRDY